MKAILQVIKESKEGFIFYEWAKPLPEGGYTKNTYHKLSYVKLFEPWGWVIGTGIYIDDVNVEMRRNIFKSFVFVFVGFVILLLVFIGIIYNYTKPIENIVKAIKKAKEGKFDEKIDVKRKDEIGEIAESLNNFIKEYEKFAWFEKVFYTSENPLFLVDVDFKFKDCNYSAIKISGFRSREEFLSSEVSLADLSPPFQPDGRDSFEKAREMLRIALERGYNKFEWILFKGTGERIPLEISLTPIIYKGEQMVYCVWRDLSKEKELYFLSITDHLTKVYNRNYFIERLDEEIKKAEREKETFSLIMVDIDRFKKINDVFGHAVGDKVLVKTIEVIKNRVRKTDIICRWGGEEFIILLPKTPIRKAVLVAEELRKNISNIHILGIDLNITASFGVVSYCPGDTVETIIERVDIMMYKAKSEGRNCVRSTDKCE